MLNAKVKQTKPGGRTSRPSPKPQADHIRTSPSRSFTSRKSPSPGADKPFSPSSEAKSGGSNSENPVITAIRNQRGKEKAKEESDSASMPQQRNHDRVYHSFGKRTNIIAGLEPKLPRSLLEGRHSERMVQLKGRDYNEEDWFDDSKPETAA
jgi:hypothetical protein